MRHRSLLMFIALASCSSPGLKTYYPEDQLVPVFIDIHIAKAAVQNAPPSVRDSLYEQYFLQLCSIHQVDPDSMQHDLDMMTREPDLMERLYVHVVDSMEARMELRQGSD